MFEKTLIIITITTGIYIMQNTMVREGGWSAGEKIKLGVREKN